jgi:hypothetical protein
LADRLSWWIVSAAAMAWLGGEDRGEFRVHGIRTPLVPRSHRIVGTTDDQREIRVERAGGRQLSRSYLRRLQISPAQIQTGLLGLGAAKLGVTRLDARRAGRPRFDSTMPAGSR